MRKPHPKPSRPMEYIAFFIMDMPTHEGTAYVFMAYDPYLDMLMKLAVELSCDENALFKALFYLAEDPLFQEHRGDTFHLVMDSFENEKERIDKMLAHSGGQSLFHRAYHTKLMNIIAKNLADFSAKSG